MVRSKQPTTWNVTVSISAQGLDWKNWKQNEGARTKTIEVKQTKDTNLNGLEDGKEKP
jgi:hypothetical protein